MSQLAVPKLVEQVALNAWKSRRQPRLSASASQPAPPQFRQRAASWLKRWGCCTVRRLN
nr:hypothetical protein [Klebsiella pneumoniae subsp. pneumoniae]